MLRGTRLARGLERQKDMQKPHARFSKTLLAMQRVQHL